MLIRKRCVECRRVLFEHARPLGEIVRAAGVLRLKCKCNAVLELP